ncbi:MAG: NAD(P)/FAD-dependent oxidoreductase [Candidatus Helarchaeota archaeon]|nr:NAD(P)/FAD-dependent oxidoreductase [Candidatus Helarchaeota archaeon]
MYDVTISGAGPAGALCGSIIAKAGYNVIIFDKAKLPWRKPCGGGVPEHVYSEGLLNYDELKRANIIEKDTKDMYLRSNTGKELIVETPGETVVDRKIFDQYLRDKALDAGAIIQDQKTVIDIVRDDNDYINGVKIKDSSGVKEINSNIVIAADGVGSKIVVKAGLRKKWTQDDYAICSVALIEGYIESEPLSNSMQLFIDDNIAPNSYAWLFPMRDNKANIGVGIWKKSKKRAMDYLMKLTQQPFFKKKIDEKKFKIFWKSSYPIPIQGVKGRTYGDGVMGIGDSMGFVAPIIGEGIFSALLTGKLAAQSAIKALKIGDYSKKILKEYQRNWAKFGLKEGYNFQKMMRDMMVDNIDENFNKLIDWALENEENRKLIGEMFVSGTSLVGNIPSELISKITKELLPRIKSK